MSIIENYKNYLDIGTNEGLRYDDESKSRYVSFKYCLNHLKKLKNQDPNKILTILEMGTCRSFVDGKFEGCNSDDSKYWNGKDHSKWDWGGGCFGLVFGQELSIDPNNKVELLTVDIIASHIRRCKIMTDSLGIKCSHIVSDAAECLDRINNKLDLIYMDTGDMWPIEYTEELQLREAKKIVELNILTQDGLILIDDVLNGTPQEQGDHTNFLGKSTFSIPYLLDNGYETVFEGYQYILKRKNN